MLVVAAVDSNDNLASFSNYGNGVMLAAPGVNVLSSDRSSNTATSYKSGTSFSGECESPTRRDSLHHPDSICTYGNHLQWDHLSSPPVPAAAAANSYRAAQPHG